MRRRALLILIAAGWLGAVEARAEYREVNLLIFGMD